MLMYAKKFCLVSIWTLGSLLLIAGTASAELLFVQSFEKGLTPDYTLAAEKPLAVQGNLKTVEGWVTDAAVFGDDGLQSVTYQLASPFQQSREGTVRFNYTGKGRGEFFTLSGPGQSVTLSGDGKNVIATIVVRGKKITRNSPFDFSKKKIFVPVRWTADCIRVGYGDCLELPAPIPFAFDTVTIGSRTGTPARGALDEFAVYDEFQPPGTDRSEQLMLSWIPDKRVAAVVRELGYRIRLAEAQGFDVAYCKVPYHIARMAALRCRIKDLDAKRKKAMLEFVTSTCSDALVQVKGIVSGRITPLRVPDPDLTGLTVRHKALVTREGEPVLLAQPMRGPNINSTKGITNNNRIYVYDRDNWGGNPSANAIAEEMNKAIYVSSAILAVPRKGDPDRGGDEAEFLRHVRHVVRTIDKGFAETPCPRAFAISLLNYESGGHLFYDSRTLARFADYLARQYGEIRMLNFTWGTDYASFAEAQPPRWRKGDKKIVPNNRAAWYDWQTFSAENNTRFYREIKKISREELQHLHVPVNVVDCGQLMYPCRSGVIAYDWDAMAGVNDIAITEGLPRHPRTIQPFAIDPVIVFQDDLQVSLHRPDQTVINMEHHCATPGSGRYATDNYYACALFREMFHGASCVGLWSGFHPWGDSIYHGKPVKGYFASIYQRAGKGKELPGIATYYKAILDCRRLAKDIVRFRSAPASTALLYSTTTMRQIPPSHIRDNSWSEHEASFRRFYQALNPLGGRIHILTDRQIADGKCAAHKLIILPAVSHLSIPLVKALSDYTKNGGTLLIASGSLQFDEHHKVVTYLEALFGLRLAGWRLPGGRTIPSAELGADADAIEHLGVTYRAKPVHTRVIPENTWMDDRSELLTDGGLIEVFEPETADAKTLLADEQGLPVLYGLRYGRGHVYILTVPLTYISYLRILERIRTDIGIETPVRVETPDGTISPAVEMRCVQTGHAIVVYVINLMETPLEDVRLRVRGGAARYFDLIDNRPMGSHLSLKRLETRIIRIDLPAP